MPVTVLVLGGLAVVFFALPFIGLLWRAPWGDAWSILFSDDALTALRLSLWCSLWATLAALVFGVPLAWLLARVPFPGRGIARALCTLSMVLPPVVGGVALFYALGRRGLVGQYLDQWFGFTLPFSTAGVIVAQTFVAMPFLVLTVEAAFRQQDTRFEDAARTLGASRWYVFRRVTLPAIRPGLIAGAVLAWARALGEFGATITFAGNFPGRTQTMPLAIYLANEIDPAQAIVLSLVLIAVSFGVLVALRDRYLGGGGAAVAPLPMTLYARIVHTIGTLHLDVELGAGTGETVAILGPNGAGKTTLFRCLCGLAPIDEGVVTLDGEALDEPARRVFVEPERRPVAVVFQDYLLFPNLSALENVAFGLRARGVARAEARARAAAWLERVGLGDRAGHRPRALSGGQAQRVALARALAGDPRLLLLDEPLAALDAGARGTVRRDLRRHLSTFGGVRLLVTHDPVDAYALADRVVIVEHGRVVQTGSLADVSARPRSTYIAELIGINLFTGHGAGDVVTTASGGRVVTPAPVDGPTFAAVQPHAVALYRTPPDGSPRNVWAVTVADVDRQSDRVRVRLAGSVPLVAEITPAALESLGLRPGDAIWATVKATEVATYPA